ncbi:MAG: hypothetical protein AAFW65_04190 [Pseudomonadota bacterium]
MARPLILLAFAAFAAGPLAAQAETAKETDAVYACIDIETDADRLACYDDAVGRLKTAEDTGEITTVSRTEVEQVQREAFGFSLPSLPAFTRRSDNAEQDNTPDEVLDRVTFGVAEIERSRYGKLFITLDNGQVWRQLDSDRVSYSARKGVESVEIRRAAFGSFKMKLDGGRAFKVKRVE